MLWELGKNEHRDKNSKPNNKLRFVIYTKDKYIMVICNLFQNYKVGLITQKSINVNRLVYVKDKSLMITSIYVEANIW